MTPCMGYRHQCVGTRPPKPVCIIGSAMALQRGNPIFWGFSNPEYNHLKDTQMRLIVKVYKNL